MTDARGRVVAFRRRIKEIEVQRRHPQESLASAPALFGQTNPKVACPNAYRRLIPATVNLPPITDPSRLN